MSNGDDRPLPGLTYFPDNGWLAQIRCPRDEIGELIDELTGHGPLPTMSTEAVWIERSYRVGRRTHTEVIRVIRTIPNRPQEDQS